MAPPVESVLMTSLYNILGARPDDDADALKKAFRNAVKAHHPDLCPDDPTAPARFRQIASAYALLSDATQRAIYDRQLQRERQQFPLGLKRPQLQRHERQQFRLKPMHAAVAIAAVGALFGGYGLLSPALTTASATAKADAMGSRTDVVGTPVEPAVAHLVERPAARDKPRGKGDGAGVPDAVIRPSTDASATDSGKALVVAQTEPVLAPLSNDANFYRERGIAAYRSGDFLGAIGNFDEAIRLNPDDEQSYNFRGNVWDELGIFERALADYDVAIRTDPNSPAIFLDRAILWQRRGELDKALIDLDRAIRFSFSDASMYCDRGLVWYEKGRHDRALADFNRAIKLDPDAAAASIQRGLIVHRNGEFTLATLHQVIRVDPSIFAALRQSNSRP